jgi:hypothetical protein
MAYLGNAPARSFISFERQVFTIVNSQTAYTLSHSVNNENDIRLVINNIVQEPGSGKAYTASGTTLTLSAALTNGTDEMYCVFLGRAVAAIAADAITEAKIADDAVESEHLNDNVISGQTELAAEPADTDEFLVSDAGTLKRIDYSYIKASSAFEKISTTTISSGVDSVDFTTLSTDYRDFRIVISGLVLDTHQEDVVIRVKRSGQSSFDSGGTDYRYSNQGTIYDSSEVLSSSNGAASLKIHPTNIARDATVDGATFNAVIDAVDVHGTTNSKFFHYRTGFVEGAYGSVAHSQGAGYRYDTSETALIGIQITNEGSTQFTSGTVTLYGRKN